jgi:hypothetical protein
MVTRTHWMGEAELHWERTAEDVDYRRLQDEMADARNPALPFPAPLEPDGRNP